ncbi:MAG: BolA family protein [Betaproteobacteria bacterium]
MSGEAERAGASRHEVEERLCTYFPGAEFELVDETHLHAGHAGAKGGASHFRLRIRHERFAGLKRLERHRLVYDALTDWMPARIHALSVVALSPEE